MIKIVDLRQAEKFRYERMVRALGLFGHVALLAALAGLFLPDPVGTVFSGLAVGVVVAAPLLRVIWLAARWYSRGDRRYASVAVALLVVVSTGSVIAFVTH